MRVVIAGSRTINDYGLLVETIRRCPFRDEITEVGSGLAAGVDQMAIRYANAVGLPVAEFRATGPWPAAGHIRNRRMAEWCDGAILLWDGKSPGTLNMLENVRRLRKQYHFDVDWRQTKSLQELFGDG